MIKKNIQEILEQLTLEEKARLCTGKDFWNLHGIERLDLPSVMVTDGPHGLRKQTGSGDHIGINASVPATCFPSASGLAATWNRSLLYKMGEALGRECRAEEVSVLLGPGINIKRNPLGGRNFEYYSEDPLLSGALSTAWIQGVQSQNTGTSLKHFAVNNHEHCRMTVDAIVDERTLREIYLPAFESAVKDSQPWTVMCAYNRVNGTYCAENSTLLSDILCEEWGFEGIVVTDWGANNDRVAGIRAGQHLEMPGSGELNTQKIIAAVEAGSLTMEELDTSVSRILELIIKSKEALKEKPSVNLEDHHTLASQIAAESVVLLKNDGAILPLQKEQTLAVIGALAENTRYQGAGSSKINPYRLEQPLKELKKVFGSANILYSQGYPLHGELEKSRIELARKTAEQADKIIFFAGLTPEYESEGFDRSHMDLPQVQLDLIDQLSDYHHKMVVVLQNGAPVTMPFADSVSAILEAYLGGQAGASALADILSGTVNPSGKLAETFPLSIDSVPSQPYFPGSSRQSQYREGIWVGYRYFDTTGEKVLFPFGHGLSYTQFEYSALKVMETGTIKLDGASTVPLSLTVKNTGDRGGAEVVQLYLGQKNPSVHRPLKELRRFTKIFLEPGESREIEFSLSYRDFAFWCTHCHGWLAESDTYSISVGSSIADIRLSTILSIDSITGRGERPENLESYFNPALRDFSDSAFEALLGHAIPEEGPPFPYSLNSLLGEIDKTEKGKALYKNLLNQFLQMMAGENATKADELMARSMVREMPLRNLPVFNPDKFSEDDILELIGEMNNNG